MKKLKRSEADIQKSILAWLKFNGYLAWRNYVGPVIRNTGEFSRNPMAGLPDICGIFKSQPGRLFMIEVKTEDGKISDKQKKWIMDLTKAGVVVFIARDLDTVRKVFAQIEEHINV